MSKKDKAPVSVEERFNRRKRMAAQADFERAVKRVPPPRDFRDAPVYLSVKDLRVAYKRKDIKKGTAALKGISFDIKQGEVVFVMGRNGHGKSTLLDLLARRSKAKHHSGVIKTPQDEFNLKAKLFGTKKKYSLSNVTIWDEEDHKNQHGLGKCAREASDLNQVTTLIVSHRHIGDTFDHADRVIFLHEGQIIWNDTPQKTIKAYDQGDLPKDFVKFINKAVEKDKWNLDLSRAVVDRPKVPAFEHVRK